MAVKQQATAVRGKPWKKGQSGNPHGRPPLAKSLAEAVRNMGCEPSGERPGISKLQAVLVALYRKAMKGDERAAALLFERGFGKVTQPMDIESTQRLISINWDASLPPDDDE